MDKISTILVPYDFSETSKNALDYTVDFIGQDKNIKILLTYISSDGDADKTEEAFTDLRNQYSSTLKSPMEWISKSGSLTESILKLQQNQDIDLVIMGTSGVGDQTDVAVTNTAKLVLEADNCPVLVIPEGVKSFAMEKIALVLGKNKIDDRSALETLLHITRRFNAKVIVLTIQNEEGLYGYSEADESNENLLEYYLENFYSHHTFIENPDIVQGIADYTSTHDIDMVTILPRNHAQGSTPSEGRLTKELTMHSKVPILAID
ncbi:MAG: universal stress protein [Aurantibacter sp.]